MLEHLQSLEEELLKDPTRTSRESLEKLLSVDFVEFGGSGRVFNRDSMIASLVKDDGTTRHTIYDFALLRLAPGAALVTYRNESRSVEGDLIRESLRSSLWVQEDGGWVVRFHQGTRKM